MSNDQKSYGESRHDAWIKDCNEKALQQIRDFDAKATKSLSVGDEGMDYFHGKCRVTAITPDRATIIDGNGLLQVKVREYWSGLVMDKAVG